MITLETAKTRYVSQPGKGYPFHLYIDFSTGGTPAYNVTNVYTSDADCVHLPLDGMAPEGQIVEPGSLEALVETAFFGELLAAAKLAWGELPTAWDCLEFWQVPTDAPTHSRIWDYANSNYCPLTADDLANDEEALTAAADFLRAIDRIWNFLCDNVETVEGGYWDIWDYVYDSCAVVAAEAGLTATSNEDDILRVTRQWIFEADQNYTYLNFRDTMAFFRQGVQALTDKAGS